MSLGEIYTNTLITYDGAGNRLQLTQGGTTTTYTLDYAGGMRVLYEQGGAFADTKHYLYGLACIAELVNADDPNTKKWRYYHQDGQPLVRQTSDEQGHITLAWGYSPSGATLYGEEGPVTNLDCGATYDWGTGLIYKNGNYFDPNLQIWLSFAPLVVWQAWKPQQKKRHTSQKANNRRAILLLTLATLLLTAGCTSPGPLDPTATTLPTQTPTCTPTLPPPVIGQIPTNTPFPHPSTFTPFPTVTPVPPTIFPSVTPIYEQIPQPSNSIFPGTASIKGFGYSPSHLAIDVVPTANPDDAIGTPVYALAYGYLYRGDTSYQEVQPYQLSIKKIVSANPIQVSNAFEIGYSHVQPTRGEGIVQVGEQIGMIVDPKLDMANMHPDEYGDVLAHVHLSLRIEGVTKEPAPLLGNYLVPLPTPTP